MVSWQLLIFITEHKKEGFSYWLKVFSFCSQFSVCFKPLIIDNKAKWSVRATKHLTSLPFACLLRQQYRLHYSFLSNFSTLHVAVPYDFSKCSNSWKPIGLPHVVERRPVHWKVMWGITSPTRYTKVTYCSNRHGGNDRNGSFFLLSVPLKLAWTRYLTGFSRFVLKDRMRW